jgi:RNA polymerase sigma-70 factor (ECF subfamily)
VLDGAARAARSAQELEQHDIRVARQRVELLLDRINPRYARAIRLRILEEKSREEAARVLDVSVGTFDVVLHRAMSALKTVMQRGGTENS